MSCPLCGYRDPDKVTPQEMEELFKQTPREVWNEYMDNGYIWNRMILEEFSDNY